MTTRGTARRGGPGARHSSDELARGARRRRRCHARGQPAVARRGPGARRAAGLGSPRRTVAVSIPSASLCSSPCSVVARASSSPARTCTSTSSAAPSRSRPRSAARARPRIRVAGSAVRPGTVRAPRSALPASCVRSTAVAPAARGGATRLYPGDRGRASRARSKLLDDHLRHPSTSASRLCARRCGRAGSIDRTLARRALRIPVGKGLDEPLRPPVRRCGRCLVGHRGDRRLRRRPQPRLADPRRRRPARRGSAPGP